MINLLPYEESKQTRAAHTNLIIFRFIIFLGLAVGFLVLACVTTYFLIVFIGSQNKEINEFNNSVTYSNGTSQNSTNSLNSDLSVAKNILNQQSSYYSILSSIGQLLPAGTVIDSISIDEASINSTMNLNIYSKTSGFEPKIKESFQKSSVFSNYQLIRDETAQDDQTDYKFSINISMVINKAAI